jgi:DNA-binding CsgD family transcriptional regulator
MPRRSEHTREQIAQAIDLYACGWGETRIAEAIGSSYQPTRRLLQELRGIGALRAAERKRSKSATGPRDHRTERSRQLRRDGLTLDQIAAELGCSVSTVRRAVADLPLPRDLETGQRHEQWRDDLRRLVAEGVTSTADLARELGIHPGTVRRELQATDVPTERTRARLGRQAELAAMVTAGVEPQQAAQEIGVDWRTARRYLRELGLHRGNRARRADVAITRAIAVARRRLALHMLEEGRAHADVARTLGLTRRQLSELTRPGSRAG